MVKIAKPKLDLVFKKIFGDVNNVDLLTEYCNTGISKDIKKIINNTLMFRVIFILN